MALHWSDWNSLNPALAETISQSRVMEACRQLLDAPTLTEFAAENAGLAEAIWASFGSGSGSGVSWANVRNLEFAGGAAGDGVADDSPAVDAALASLPADGTLYLPQGIYRLTQPLVIDRPLTIRGDGWGSVLLWDGGSGLPMLVQDTGTDDQINGVFLRNFVLDGQRQGQHDAGLIQVNNAIGYADGLWIKDGGQDAVWVNGISVSAGSVAGAASEFAIRNCLVEGHTKAAINVTTGSQHVTVTGCIVRGNTGTLGQVPGIQTNGGHNVTIFANAVYDNQGDGIIVATVGTTPPIPSRSAIIAMNHCHDNGYAGIAVRNAFGSDGVFGRTVILGNQVHDNGGDASGHGIHLASQHHIRAESNVVTRSHFGGIFSDGCTKVSIVNNTCIDNNQDNESNMGGVVLRGGNEHEIAGNRCYNTTGNTTQKYGMVFWQVASDRVVLRDNDFRVNQTAPIHMQTPPVRLIASGNIRGDGDYQPLSADRGDADVTLVVGADSPEQRFDTALTTARTVTLSTTGAIVGDRFRVVCTDPDAGSLDVGGLKTIASSTPAVVEVVYTGSAWALSGYEEL